MQGLFLYLYIESNLVIIGKVQVFIGIASILFIFYFNKYKNDIKYFKYFNILLCIDLLLKVNIKNRYLLYLVAFIEGLCFKEYEYYSTLNLYDNNNNNISSYLIKSEIIFCISKSIIILLFYIFRLDLYYIMIICILGIFISSFIYPKHVKNM